MSKYLKNIGTTNQRRQMFLHTLDAYKDCFGALMFYIGVMALVAVLLAINFSEEQRVYEAGEIAETDILADRSMQVVDTVASDARRRRVMSAQPPVYDYSLDTYVNFEARLVALMNELNGAPVKEGTASAEELFAAEIGQDLAHEVLPQFGLSTVQEFILKEVLPVLRAKLAEGMVGDVRAARVPSGVAIRNLGTGTESLLQDVKVLPDIHSLLTEISNMARANKSLSHDARRAINILFAASMPPTLTLNREVTQNRANEYVSHLEPVVYQIQRGEVIARRGDRISKEQQLKIQNLYQRNALPFNWQQALGSFLVFCFISLGLFVSPSGKHGSTIHRKDLILMAVVTLLTAVSARGLHGLCAWVGSTTLADALSLAFPLAGAVGFIATVFTARRYVTLGLLLTMITTMALNLNFTFALYHFLSCMLATWLVSSSLSRQDAVWNLLPIILGEILLIVGLSLMNGVQWVMLPMLITAVCINSVLMLILFFSFSPVLETVFGYSTRFKLMEYINLEQPLMQEIMVTIPGTYHHSLVVANMVEAGAKAIGANSLLCKVAALYHDSGKLAYPLYFVENQFGTGNRHDKLAPSMSALIIISHVKKGVEICKSYGLGQEITDIVAQHHGDRVMRYFYQKAVNMGQNPQEEDFRYPGPKPQTKEAAILMLADSVEASSRTLTEPTAQRLKAHIQKIMKSILDEGQLAEADITFRDLHLLADAFQKVLTGIFHHRIVYPEDKKKDGMPPVATVMSGHPLASIVRGIPPVLPAEEKEARPAPAETAAALSGKASQGDAKAASEAQPAAAPAADASLNAAQDLKAGSEEDAPAPAAEPMDQPPLSRYKESREEISQASREMAGNVFCGPRQRPLLGGSGAEDDSVDLSGLMPEDQNSGKGSLDIELDAGAPSQGSSYAAQDSRQEDGGKKSFWSRLWRG